MAIKVSIIIPMFNVANLIDRCIDSLFSQTYRNLELLFINDCSSDDTTVRVKELISSQNQDGITWSIISHDENRGVAAARNTGLDNATGDYIYWVDADDFIEADTIEKFVKASSETLDIVVSEWNLVFNSNSRHMTQRDAINGEDLFAKMAFGVMRWNLWLFLAKRALFEENHLRFIEGVNMGEDMMMMLKLALHANQVTVIHEPLYNYIQTNAAAISKDIRPYVSQIIQNVSEVENYIASNFENKHNEEILQLKLSLKLPLLISSDIDSYKQWYNWWPEANQAVCRNPEASKRTILLQWAASKRLYAILKLYYWCVIKVVYGIIYR